MKFTCRHYNKVYLKDGKIIKECSPDKFKIESDWYKKALEYIPNNIPTIYDRNYAEGVYSMKYIQGDNAYNWMRKQTNKTSVINVVRKIIHHLHQDLHKTTQSSNNEDIKNMYLTKPLKALGFCEEMVFGSYENYTINGKSYLNPKLVLSDLYHEFEPKLLDTKYTFIHGDTTLGNTLISKESEIFFIDPRGKFGDSHYFGDPRYDFGKLIFSMVGGFDALNVGDFTLQGEGNKYEYSIAQLPNVDYLEELIFNETGLSRQILKYIHATIWLSLPPHLGKTNQRVTAFLQGTRLLNQLKENRKNLHDK